MNDEYCCHTRWMQDNVLFYQLTCESVSFKLISFTNRGTAKDEPDPLRQPHGKSSGTRDRVDDAGRKL